MDRRLRQIFLVVIHLSCALLFYPSQGYSFATSSHRDINEAAAQGSQTFNPYLTNVLGFGAGFRTPITNSQGVN